MLRRSRGTSSCIQTSLKGLEAVTSHLFLSCIPMAGLTSWKALVCMNCRVGMAGSSISFAIEVQGDTGYDSSESRT